MYLIKYGIPNATAHPWGTLKFDVIVYDRAWGAVVLEIFIALPARLEAKATSFILFFDGEKIKLFKLFIAKINLKQAPKKNVFFVMTFKFKNIYIKAIF